MRRVIRSTVSVGVTLLLLAPLAGACDRSADQLPYTARDSAGIRIVEHRPPTQGGPEEWTLSARPRVDIRQDESDPQGVWTAVRRVFSWEDGRIGLLVTDPPFLRIFEPDGAPLMRMGREGDGPGELRGAVWAGTLGDSAVILGRRFSVFGPEGAFSRVAVAPLGERMELIAPTDAGWIAAAPEPEVDDHSVPAPPRRVTADWAVFEISARGEVGDTIASFEQSPTWIVQSSLWGALRHIASDGSRVHVMDSEVYQISTYESGTIVRIVRAPIPAFPEFTEHHLGVVRAELGGLAERFIERDRAAGRFIVPPAVALLVDPEGWLWVRRTDDGPIAPERIWDVFDDGGIWTATVTTPPELVIEEVRRDQVLGIWTSETGVTSVRVYDLERPPGA